LSRTARLVVLKPLDEGEVIEHLVDPVVANVTDEPPADLREGTSTVASPQVSWQRFPSVQSSNSARP
jgi:hypothetical protein